jgi:RimJ/RimL family protein N-acetyltransferase
MTTVIETERLLLRDWRASDREPFAALNADPEVMRFIGAALTRAQSDELIARIEAHWNDHGYGLWCAAPREDPGACLGFIGLSIPAFLPAVLPAVEVGWRLARGAWGRGLATGGARAAIGHAFGLEPGDLDHPPGQRARCAWPERSSRRPGRRPRRVGHEPEIPDRRAGPPPGGP